MSNETTTVGAGFVGAPSPDVHAVDIADEVVLLHEPSGQLHLLNPTGALVWRCLDGEASLQVICADIAEAAGVPLVQVLADVETLVGDLVEAGLVARS